MLQTPDNNRREHKQNTVPSSTLGSDHPQQNSGFAGASQGERCAGYWKFEKPNETSQTLLFPEILIVAELELELILLPSTGS
ncbi:hypothetical protein CVS40_8591 [Lucilia cuprina]|nr:hypothetical protein CVS40_8591 [Lucilia cuprina]KAI8120061.1 hypothetical protein CVS40_8591 [Lucilia cuprina]